MQLRQLCLVVSLLICCHRSTNAETGNGYDGNVVPGQVFPRWSYTWDMAGSTAMMVCNNSGPVDAQFAKPWGLVDLDWNGGKVDWSKTDPMSAEEFMLANIKAIKQVNPSTIGWVYRNGIKVHRTTMAYFSAKATAGPEGLFMPLKGCMPSPGHYVCGPNATHNLYHDFEQTPHGDCGQGVECGEYVFNHRNKSLVSFLLGDYFFGPVGAGDPDVQGFYVSARQLCVCEFGVGTVDECVASLLPPLFRGCCGMYVQVDDGWSSAGPSEMDKDAVEKMGMSQQDVEAMIAAWQANQQSWRNALVAAGRFEWFLFYGGQQTAPGQNQTCGQCSCQTYLEKNCGADAPSQRGTLFYGFSRIKHSQPFPLPTPDQDLALFLLSRGPYAFFGYGWVGCADATHPFTRPPSLDVDYGTPLNYCHETAPGSQIWVRNFTNVDVSIDCSSFKASFTPHEITSGKVAGNRQGRNP